MKKLFIIYNLLILPLTILAQSTLITPGNSQPNIIANGTSNGGITPPRMTNAQIAAIPSPQVGSMVYDTDANCLRIFDGTTWKCQSEDHKLLGYGYGYGAAGDQMGHKIRTEGDYIYIAGHFENEIYFEDDYGPIILYSSGAKDGFIAKLRKDGKAVWVKQFSNTLNCYATQVCVDNSGNVYVGGNNRGSVTVGPFTLSNVNNLNDIFFAKYNSEGTFQWVQSIQGTGNDTLTAMEINSSNDLFLTGNFNSNLNLYSTGGSVGVSYNAFGNTDIFLAKYSSNGVLLVSRQIGNESPDEGTALGIHPTLGLIYLTGTTYGTINLDGFSFTPSSSNHVGFYSILNQNLTCSGFVNCQSLSPIAIKVDATSNVYIASNAVINNGVFPILFPMIKITKFDNSSSKSWDRFGIFTLSCGFTGLFNYPKIDIQLSLEGSVFLSSTFWCDILFGFTGLITNDEILRGTSPVKSSIFKMLESNNQGIIIKLNSNGDILDFYEFGSVGDDSFSSMAIGQDKNIYVTGGFSNTVNWGGSTSISSGSRDMILLKLVR